MVLKKAKILPRCSWCVGKPLYEQYHDTEWGVPVYDDAVLFEFLILEGAQAGLSWWTILQRREHYRKAFAQFDYIKLSKFGPEKVQELMQNAGIIRNRLKILSVISNAQSFIKVQKEFGSFSNYLWSFVDYKSVNNSIHTIKDSVATSKVSDILAKDLKKRGFKFLGSTIVYAYIQACGLVNDHSIDCFRHTEIKKMKLKKTTK